MWCAVSAQGLTGPFMFEDYVTGENYAMMFDFLTKSAFLGHSESTSNSRIHSACPESLVVVCGFRSGLDWAIYVWGLRHWGKLCHDARLLDKTCVSGALSIHIKFTNPLCMSRKSCCGVRFPLRAWLGHLCLRITSLGRIMPWCSTPWQNVRFWGTQHPHQIHESTLHVQKVLMWCAVSAQGLSGPFMFEDYVTGENYAMMLDSVFLQQLMRRCSLHAWWFHQDGARPHTTPEVLETLHSKFQHRSVQSFPTAIPVRILMATMQSRFKSVWLLPLRLSEGQNVQQCSPAWLGLSCLRITSLGRIMPWCSTSWQNVRFWGTQHPHQIHEYTLHVQKFLMWCAVSAQGLIGPFMFEDYVTGENYVMMLDSFLHQLRRRCSLHAWWYHQDGARPHTTPEVLEILHSKFQHRSVQSFSTAIPVRILMATMQSRFKSVWLLPLGLSEGQNVQQCSLNSVWTEGEDQGKFVYRSQQECSPVLYRTLYYVFKWFESLKRLISSMSSTTLPICEILILVCYVWHCIHINIFAIANALSSWKWQ